MGWGMLDGVKKQENGNGEGDEGNEGEGEE